MPHQIEGGSSALAQFAGRIINIGASHSALGAARAQLSRELSKARNISSLTTCHEEHPVLALWILTALCGLMNQLQKVKELLINPKNEIP